MSVESDSDPRRKILLWWVIVLLLALAARLFELSYRPLHNDEAVNHYFLSRIDALGYYPYSHLNYHGPLFFYLLWGVVQLFGDSEAALRMLSVAVGCALVVVPMLYSRLLGNATALTAGILFALSPSLVFFSRYAIHEPLLLLLQLLFALEVYQLSQDRTRSFVLAAVFAGLLVATKETFPLFFAVVLVALACSSVHNFGTLFRLRRLLGGIGVAVVVAIAVYSSGFRWMGGPVELLAAVPQWIGRGTTSDTGHFKPFFYYFLEMFLKTEPTVALALCCSAVWIILGLKATRSQQDPLLMFFSVWGGLTFLVYSAIPYKTPWLAPNITVPMLLFLSRLTLSFKRKWFDRRTAVLLSAFALAFGVSSAQMVRYNYPIQVYQYLWGIPYGSRNPFSYVHTTTELRPVAEQILDYAQRHPESLILIQSDGYWPLPYYLRDVRSQIRYLSSASVPFTDRSYGQFVCEKSIAPLAEPFVATPFDIYEGESAILYQRNDREPNRTGG